MPESPETTPSGRCEACGADYQHPRRKPGVIRSIDIVPAGETMRLLRKAERENLALRRALGLNTGGRHG